jgi:hypothetical protein
MPEQRTGPLVDLAEQFSRYLPDLTAGLLVLALGAAAGWVAKRVLIRILLWLRLDRLGGRAGWRAALGKGDARASLYNVVGAVAMVLVFLLFLNNALQILGLSVLSDMVGRVVVYLPNLGLAAAIFGLGVFLSGLLAARTEELLEEEEIPRARLVARLLRGLGFFATGALVLWQLDFARQVVLAGFLVGFGAVGVAFAIAVGIGSAEAIREGWESLMSDREEK